MATIKDLLSSMIRKINSKVSTWEELPDKPFGVENKVIEIMPEQSFTNMQTFEAPSLGTYCYTNINHQINFIANAKYNVYINGELYETVAQSISGIVPLGNACLAGAPIESTGEPFLVMNSLANNNTLDISWSAEFGETITLAIYEEQEVVKPLDPKFLPFTNAEQEGF